jgi:hypothetical protein
MAATLSQRVPQSSESGSSKTTMIEVGEKRISQPWLKAEIQAWPVVAHFLACCSISE